ncbi:MAG: hypothetical protein EP330_23035 [Deltaproteobacteria bacterium]|nr:MAG: hypothetical protein EP330_23035 [Deltaproteobacteria bacterium]
MLRLYTSDVEAATSLAAPDVVGRLFELGFVPTTGIDVVSKNQIGNMLALARIDDDVIAFITLSKAPSVTFASLLTDGGLLFTSDSPHVSVSFPSIHYTSQKFALPLDQLLERHLADVRGRAEIGHSDPFFALALQRRHAEVNEARRDSARWGLRVLNLFAFLLALASAYTYVNFLAPLVEDGLSRYFVGMLFAPVAVVVPFALLSNLRPQALGRPFLQRLGVTFGAALPARSVEETLELGDMVETGR